MSDATGTARRYHWLSEHVASFVDEPHEAECCDARAETLNLVAHENERVRAASAAPAAERPDVTIADGIPFPVDRLTYDRTIAILEKAINRSAIDRSEKVKAFRRLAAFDPPPPASAPSR